MFAARRTGDLERHLLGPRLAVLADEPDVGHDSAFDTEAARVLQIAGAASEHGHLEMADRGIGDDRNCRLQPFLCGTGVRARHERYLTAEEECETRQATRPRDR